MIRVWENASGNFWHVQILLDCKPYRFSYSMWFDIPAQSLRFQTKPLAVLQIWGLELTQKFLTELIKHVHANCCRPIKIVCPQGAKWDAQFNWKSLHVGLRQFEKLHVADYQVVKTIIWPPKKTTHYVTRYLIDPVKDDKDLGEEMRQKSADLKYLWNQGWGLSLRCRSQKKSAAFYNMYFNGVPSIIYLKSDFI